jgi:hypothetical protein
MLTTSRVFAGLFIAVCALSYMLNIFVIHYANSHL